MASPSDRSVGPSCYKRHMTHTTAIVIGLVVMVALIVGLDVAFLRNHFALRLVVNIAIVAVFAIAYVSLRHRL